MAKDDGTDFDGLKRSAMIPEGVRIPIQTLEVGRS